MKAMERGTTKYLVILIIVTAVCGIILYPLYDFIVCRFITHSDFIYSIHSHVIQPIMFGCIFGVTFWTIDKNGK